jgi:hypothetical protein
MAPHRALLCLGLALSVTGVGCSSCADKGGAAAAREDVALMPKETHMVVAVNVGRMRDTAVWRKLLDARDAIRKEKGAVDGGAGSLGAVAGGPPRDYDDFVARCALDPFTDLESLFLAFPGPPTQGELGAVVHGKFDEAKLVACARAVVEKEGGKLVESEHQGKKVYTDPTGGTLSVAFLDAKTIVMGGPTWAKKILDRAAGKAPPGEGSAKDHEALAATLKKVRTGDAIWGAAVLSDAVREQIKANPRLQSAASMKDLYGSVDFTQGLSVWATVDLGSPTDAAELAKKVGEQVTQARQNPQVMVTGMTRFVDAVKVEAEGAAFKLSIKLDQQQVDDLVTRVEGLMRGIANPRKLLGPLAQ